MDAPILWDETLRDGEQTPGVHFTLDEKIEIACGLDALGVPILCGGIPAVSPREQESLRAIAKQGLDAQLMAAGRTLPGDIDAILESDADAAALFVAVSDVHLRYKLKRTREQVIDLAVDAITYAVDHGLPPTLVTEDTVRADLGFVTEIHQAAADAGADRFLFCDTVGVLTPVATRWFFDQLRHRGVPEPPSGWAFHNHNDLGLATANALAAWEAGVPCLSATVNGIGERAGNTALEELVTAFHLLYDVDTSIDLQGLVELAGRVELAAGVPVDATKPVTGAHALTRTQSPWAVGNAPDEPLPLEKALGKNGHEVLSRLPGPALLQDQLRRAGIQASAEQVAHVAKRTEARAQETASPTSMGAWARDHTAAAQGVDDRTFWEFVQKVTGPRVWQPL